MRRRGQRSEGVRRPRLTAAEITPEVFANEGFNEKRAEAKANEVKNGAVIMEQNLAFPENRPCRDAVWGIIFSMLTAVMIGFAMYYIFAFATEPATFAIPQQDSGGMVYNDTTPLPFLIESSTPLETSAPAGFVTTAPSSLVQAEEAQEREGITQRLLQELQNSEESEVSEKVEQDSGTMVGLLLTVSIVGGVVGLAAGFPFILLAHKYTNTVVHVALLLGPALLIFSGVSMLLASVSGGAFGIFLLIFGVLSIALGIGMLFLILCCWGKLIPFTIRVVELVAGVAKKFPALMIAPVIGGLLGSLWVLLCFVVFAGTGLRHYESLQHADKHQRYAGVFTVFLVLYWGAEVARCLAHMTICGVYGQWYFGLDRNKSKGEVVMSSLRVALVTSYGSICLGTFLVAIIQALEMVARQMMEDARREGNAVGQCLACIIACALSCIGDIMEYFNEWAYVQCAIRGLSFFDAAKVTYSLCTLANVTYILDDLLINYVVLLGSLLCAVVGAIAGAVLGLAWDGGIGFAAGMLIGFISAYTSGSAAMSVFSSGTKTILACWAESPETLRLKDGAEAPGAVALAHDFEHGPHQEDEDMHAEGV